LNEIIDTELWLDALNYMIISARQNLCWIMERVTVDRDDEWRDRKFNEIKCQIDAMVAERGELVKEMGRVDA
jgi:hypothetical protein